MRLWLKSADGKSSVAAAVSDLNNGSYVGEALLKWPGVTLVRVSLTYPVEYLRALTEMFHTVHTLRWITDIFDDGKGSQEVGLAGTGIAQFLERRTHDRKVAGSNPRWSGGRIYFLLQGQLSVLTLISVSVPPPVLPQ